MIGSSRMRWLGASAALMALVSIPAGARAASGVPGSNGPGRSPIALDDAGGSSGGGSSGGSGSGSCVAWAPGSSGGSGSSGAGSSGSGAGSSGSGAGSSSGSGGNLPADVQPPSAPGSVVVSAVTSSSATVAWTASTDDVGVTAYWIHARPAGGPEVPVTVGVDGCTHWATVTGLTPQTTYDITVEAEDLGGHRTRSAPVPATTADPPPFSLSVEPRSVAVTCGTPASATVRVIAAPGFTGTVQLAADFGLLQVAFSPAATASTSTVTFSCDPFPGGGGGGGGGPVTITGSSDSGVASTELSLLFFSGNLDPGGDPGGSSSSSSGGNVDPGGNWGGSSGGYVGPGGSSSGGGSSGGSGGWSSSGGSSGGSSSGAIGGSSRTGADSGSGALQTGCTSAGGADAGSLALALLLWAGRAPRRRGAARPAV